MNTQNQILYAEYIEDHVKNVRVVWDFVSKNLLKGEFWIDESGMAMIDPLIESHDESKKSIDEFEGYRQFFYPVNGVNYEPLQSMFDIAWNHHQKFNPHHWEYWCLIRGRKVEPLPMPFWYVIEMLCDWSAMSLKFGDTPGSFYESKKDGMLLNPSTVSAVERWLPVFDEAVTKLNASRGQHEA